ncbi:hypothetical protein AVEN_59098-1 [Araneus ventricosus]|uniref:RNase H type-1 domain-containing protein n=1 Tax=Araneus ventricosus TaxID=182803 RepID=A0A4Y2NQG3_ARAVE|nr:hypothetical protein AVEN_59098-1 [Araneus ventricosus]
MWFHREKGISTSIWIDSESAVRAISSFESSNPLIQETQQALLQNPSMQLNWIKAHVGFPCNEAADNLAKQVTKEGTHHHLQARNVPLKCLGTYLSIIGNKTGIQAILGEKYLIFFLKSLKHQLHGQENPSSSLQTTVLFPAISIDSGFIIQISSHAGKRETLSTTQLLVIVHRLFIVPNQVQKILNFGGKTYI